MITVYALLDPRDETLRYVGRTSNMKSRFTKHNSVQTNVGTPKNDWIRELRSLDLRPVLQILEEVETKKEGKFWEEHYTSLFRSWGFDILNNRYRKFGNQTSFQPGNGNTPVVAVTQDGLYFKTFPSVNAVYSEYGKICVPQCLMGIKKRAAGMVWFYEKDYWSLTPAQIREKVNWANTDGRKGNIKTFEKFKSKLKQ